MFLRENQVGEATKIANSGVIENEVLYFQSIANALSIAIEVFNGNEHKIYCEQNSYTPKVMISIVKFFNSVEYEYASLQHELYNTFSQSNDSNLLRNQPFLYSLAPKVIPHASTDIDIGLLQGPGVSNNIPKFEIKHVKSQESPIDKTSEVSEILKFFAQIMFERDLTFSINEINLLKPHLKILKQDQVYQEAAIQLLSLMKRKKCEHGFKSFIRLECKESHCIECIRDEIKLKSLRFNQIFCSCKLRVSDADLLYYLGVSSSIKANPLVAPQSQSPQKVSSFPDSRNPLPENRNISKPPEINIGNYKIRAYKIPRIQ